jgi:hypothetical protein
MPMLITVIRPTPVRMEIHPFGEGLDFSLASAFLDLVTVFSRIDICCFLEGEAEEPRLSPLSEGLLYPVESACDSLLPTLVLLIAISRVHLGLPFLILGPIGAQVFHAIPEANR